MKEIQPVYHLPVRGDQIVGTAQGKTQRDSQLPRAWKGPVSGLHIHKQIKLSQVQAVRYKNSKRTETKLLLLERSIRVSVCRNCNSTTVFGSIKSYASCRTF